MTYAEIYARRKALGMEHLSIEEFSKLYGDNPDFAAGTSGGFVGQALKATSAGVDRFLGATGLPEATGEIFARIPQVATLGASGPSEAWRDAGRGIPRGAATTAAAVLSGGVGGAVAMGGLTGVDVYEKTDSPLAGSVGALIGMVTPLAGQLAGRGAAGVATRVLPRVFSNEVTKAAVTRGVTVSAPGVFKSAATRAVEFAGQQAGYLGAGLLTQASTGAIAAPDGQGWDAFKAPFTPENIVMSAATNLPFMANDIMQVRAQNRVVRGEADAAAVAARYDEIDRLRGLNAPRVEGPSFTSSDAVTDRLGLSVDARESRLGLPWTPNETPAQRGYRELVAQSRLNASMPRTSLDAGAPAGKVERVVPQTNVAEAFRRSQNELVYNTGLLRSVAKTAPPTVVTKLADAAALPVEQRLIADDPQVKYAAAAEVTGVSADDAVARITTKFDAGEDDSVATLELAQQLHAEATEAIAVQRRNEDRAAELSLRVAPDDDAVPPTAEEIQVSAEQTAAFDDALRPFAKNAVVQAKLRETSLLSSDSTQLNPDVILRSAVLRWKQESPTADAESLVRALRGVDKLLRKEGVDPKSLMSVSEIRDDGTVVLQKGKAKHFATRDEADVARVKLQTDDGTNEFQWSVIQPRGTDYFTITRRSYFRTAIGGEVTDFVMDSATAGLVPAADAPRMIVKDRARRPEEHAAARIVDRAADGDDAVEQFVAKVPRDVVEELGTGDGDTGAVRLEALLRLRAATTPAEKARWADVVRTSFGGDKVLTNAWVKDATTQGLLTAWDAQRGTVSAAMVKKARKVSQNSQEDYEARYARSLVDRALPLWRWLGALRKDVDPYNLIQDLDTFIGFRNERSAASDFAKLSKMTPGERQIYASALAVIRQAESRGTSKTLPAQMQWAKSHAEKLLAMPQQELTAEALYDASDGIESAALFDSITANANKATLLALQLKQALQKFGDAAVYDRDAFITPPREEFVTLRKMLATAPTANAVTPAGGGFWFNVAGIVNGKMGKHTVEKSGRMSEADFVKRGRGTDQPLKAGEVELYKLLVPEAFDAGFVDVPRLLSGLRDNALDVQVYGQGGKVSAAKAELDKLTHDWYDQLTHERQIEFGNKVRWGHEADDINKLLGHWPADDLSKAVAYQRLKDTVSFEPAYEGPRATTHYDAISPFDTKKFPVVRVDVVLPPRTKAQWEKTAKLGDSVEMEVRGDKQFVKSDVKWQQDDLHENLPNTLGWAMVQFVPGANGETVAFVGEQQSRWGQSGRKDASVATHPLLDVQHELVLKAVVREARKRGVTKVVLTDGETAMMTERHDTSIGETYSIPANEHNVNLAKQVVADPAKFGFDTVPGLAEQLASGEAVANVSSWGRKQGFQLEPRRPAQEGGMRLHYDTTLPATMSRIAGNKGTKVDLGVHKNARGTNAGFNEQLGRMTDSNDIIGSPVFRNPDGTPKTNITGTVYDISGVAVGERGSGPAFGGNMQPAYVGERRTLSELLRTVGLDDTWTDEAARLVTLYDNSDVAYAQITGATDAAGLFTVQRDGQKLVWLSQQNNPRRTLFALTHELNGHALWQAMRDGRLDAETTNRMQQFESLVKESSPETNRVMLQELWRHLPDDVRNDAGLKKLVDLASSDPEEVLANINAVASLNLVHSTKSVWRDMLTYLPKPLADVLVAMARMSRRMFESINGLMFSREHGWNAGAVNAKARAELGTYIDSLYGVLRYDRERSAQAAKALRMGLLTDSEARFTAAQSPEYWAAANTDEATVLQAMGLVNEAETKPNRVLPEGSVGFTRMFGPMGAFAVKYPELRRVLNTGSRREAESALMEKAAMAELGFERQGFKIVAGAPESNPILRVEQVVRLAEQRDAIIQRANVAQKPVEQLIAEGDAKVTATLNGMSVEDQTLVRSALAQHESFNKKTNALALEKKYDRLAFITAEALLNKDANMSVATAETLARELIAARRGGKPFAGNEPNAVSLASFVDTAAQGIEDAHAFFVQRPYYVSYRRFGEFSATVKFSDKRPELARSFDTQEARDTWLAEFEGDPRASVKLHKNKFRTKNALGNEALEILREHESKNLEALTSALVVNGMDADTAKSLVGRFSTYGEVQRELAAKAVPGKAPHRRFVAGYEELNTTEQQMQYLQLLSHGLTKAVGDAEFNMLMAGPQGRAFVDRDTVRKAWEQYKTPDSETVKNVRKASYLMYMLLHPINMIQDAAAPLIGALPAWMINDGAGVVQAHKLIGAAMADAKSTKRTTADEQAMLKWFRDSNQGLASYSDESNNAALSLHNLHAVANGRKTAAGLGEWLAQKRSSALLHTKQFHRHATNYGMEAGMLAAYRWQRGKGLDHNAAVAAAFDFTMPAMAAQGKSGRAQGIWDAGALTPVTASITSLQSFAMNTLFTAKGTFERAIGRVPGLTGKQRVDAGKAFVATLGLMAVTGGIMGVVGVAPALTLIDKVFGTNSREALADLLRGDDDDSYDDVVQQVAMHGALSVTGGPDFGSRFASQGFLGFNGYDGWSVETMLGTGYDLVKRVFTLPAALADEGAGALTRLAPQPFKRGLDAWKNDWEFRRKDGSLIDESTPWEQSLHAVLGVKPVRIANIQERDTWQRIDAQNDSDARAAWLDDMMSLMDDGRFDEVRQQTVQRAASRDGERPDMIAQKLAEQYVERLYGRMAGRRAGYNARLARTSPGDSMTEMQRLTLEDSVRQRLNMGFATSPAMVRRARDVDAIRALNPTMSVKSAREFIERRSGSNVLRGATYQRR